MPSAYKNPLIWRTCIVLYQKLFFTAKEDFCLTSFYTEPFKKDCDIERELRIKANHLASQSL